MDDAASILISETRLKQAGWDSIQENGFPIFYRFDLPLMVLVNCDGDFEVENSETREFVCLVSKELSVDAMVDAALTQMEEDMVYA